MEFNIVKLILGPLHSPKESNQDCFFEFFAFPNDGPTSRPPEKRSKAVLVAHRNCSKGRHSCAQLAAELRSQCLKMVDGLKQQLSHSSRKSLHGTMSCKNWTTKPCNMPSKVGQCSRMCATLHKSMRRILRRSKLRNVRAAHSVGSDAS